MWIRLLLMAAVGGASLVLLRGHRGARHLAIRRLLLLGFVAAAGLSLLFPGAWQQMADAVGVGRGTDLLLYALIAAFLGFVATSYLRFRDLQHQLTEVARQLALASAPPLPVPLPLGEPLALAEPRVLPGGRPGAVVAPVVAPVVLPVVVPGPRVGAR